MVVLLVWNGAVLAVGDGIVDTQHRACYLWTTARAESVPEKCGYVSGIGFHVLFCVLFVESQVHVCAPPTTTTPRQWPLPLIGHLKL